MISQKTRHQHLALHINTDGLTALQFQMLVEMSSAFIEATAIHFLFKPGRKLITGYWERDGKCTCLHVGKDDGQMTCFIHHECWGAECTHGE